LFDPLAFLVNLLCYCILNHLAVCLDLVFWAYTFRVSYGEFGYSMTEEVV